MKNGHDNEQINELLYQSLETEIGGVKIYKTALRCVVDDDLKEEWEKYLGETQNHERMLREVFDKLGLDPETETPGRKIVHHLGSSLVMAMEMALKTGHPNAAQLVAVECVVLAETKDHMNWELIGKIAEKKLKGEQRKIVLAAYEEVESQEDEHIYHSKGWARELWIESLGMPAVLPPPEEVKKVETAIGAARAEQAREQML